MADSNAVSLDLTRLSEIADGDDEIIAAVVTLYLDTATDALDTLMVAARSGDQRALVSTAHRLRGASGSAGANVMWMLACQLESDAAAGGDTNVVLGLVGQLLEELSKVRAAALRRRCLIDADTADASRP